jgi:hypothetical protein
LLCSSGISRCGTGASQGIVAALRENKIIGRPGARKDRAVMSGRACADVRLIELVPKLADLRTVDGVLVRETDQIESLLTGPKYQYLQGCG